MEGKTAGCSYSEFSGLNVNALSTAKMLVNHEEGEGIMGNA